MKLAAALVLVTTLSTASGFWCYVCSVRDPKPCTDFLDCDQFNYTTRCFTAIVFGGEVKGCLARELCVGNVSCCDADLCNSAPVSLAPPPVLLMSLSAAVLTRSLNTS